MRGLENNVAEGADGFKDFFPNYRRTRTHESRAFV